MEEFIGLWSDGDLYLGSMEANELVLAEDGTGWSRWYNALDPYRGERP